VYAGGVGWGQAHGLGTAAGAKHQADAALHGFQAHGTGVVTAIGGAGDEAVPLNANPFFHAAFSS